MFDTEADGPILVLAPHPDDETLGAGGALLRAKKAGRKIHWLICTKMMPEDDWDSAKIERREAEISEVADSYGFDSVHILPFPAARLDTVPIGDVVSRIGDVVRELEPEILLLPHRGDAHSDHAVIHDAGSACGKWFRYPSVRWTVVYETLSETDAALQQAEAFLPNMFVDISQEIEQKIEILKMFGDEIQPFPFPRSEETVTALATLRGSACGVRAAEAFMLLRTRL